MFRESKEKDALSYWVTSPPAAKQFGGSSAEDSNLILRKKLKKYASVCRDK